MQVYLLIFYVFLACAIQAQQYVKGNSFKDIADHVRNEYQQFDPKNVKHADIIFLKTDYMPEFFTQLLPEIEHPFILITHNSDYGAPGEFVEYLDDPRIIKMFSENPTTIHKKLVPIPIGICNPGWSHGTEEHFDYVRQNLLTYSKKHLVGINFSVGTYLDLRTKIYNLFKDQHYCKDVYTQEHLDYLIKAAECEYILSPRGNGLDCHRTWEAMLVGAIPIIETSFLDPIYSDMPVLIVKDWTEINYDMLVMQKEIIGRRRSPKLFFEYWKELVLKEKRS